MRSLKCQLNNNTNKIKNLIILVLIKKNLNNKVILEYSAF